MNATAARHWLATADSSVARWVRRGARGLERTRARLRSGSVAAEMDRIVATAMDTSQGVGIDASLSRRRRTIRGRDGARSGGKL